MEQMSAHDASFVYIETKNAHMGGVGLSIYDQSTAPGGAVSYKGILEHLERRLHLAPRLRQRIIRVPMDIDHPYWVDDPKFDLEFHVRHIALPKPGDWRQLCIQTARLASRPLDLDRPPWEMYVIEGLDNIPGYPKGSFAIVSKSHHATGDGAAGSDMVSAIHDLSPKVADDGPPEPWTPEPQPSAAELMHRAHMNHLMMPMRYAEVFGKAMQAMGRPAPAVASTNTRFNAVVGPHRVVDAVSFDLAGVKAMRRAVPGATVNDVLLAIVGGGLRAYLQTAKELPSASLVAMVPISTREPNSTEPGNQVSAMFVPLHTDIADPVARLAAVHADATESKAMANAVGAKELIELSRFSPGHLVVQAARVASETRSADHASAPYNTVVTNVPGPQEPLYMCGAKVVAQYGFGMVHDAMGLMHCLSSYCGELTLGFISDRDMMPDPARYAECLQSAHDQLAKATAAQPGSAATSAKSTATRAKATRAKSTPAKATPAKTTPTKATRAKSTPAKTTPAKAKASGPVRRASVKK